jgi:hypothetical protein
VIFQVVEPRHLHDGEVIRGEPQLAADGGAILGRWSKAICVDAVVDDLDAALRDALVVNERLLDRLAHRDGVVLTAQHPAVEQHALAARVVRLVPAVLGEEDWRRRVEQPS